MLGRRRLVASRGRLHDALIAGRNVEWPVLVPIILVRGGVNDESPVEAVAGSELLVADLVTDGAGHAVSRGRRLLRVSIERQKIKNLPFCPFTLAS